MRGLRFLATLAVIVGSLLPGGSAALHALALLHINDKIQHFAAYAVLACFAGWMESRRAACITCTGLVGLGILLEILQLFVPGRSCELLDAAADLAGVICGWTLGAGLAWLASLRGARVRVVLTGLEFGGKVQQPE